jgi:general stress protein YciG
MGKFTSETAREMGRRGGRRTVEKHGPTYMSHIGKRGFQVTVDRYYAGDRAAYCWRLSRLGLIALDPEPANGAWTPGAERMQELIMLPEGGRRLLRYYWRFKEKQE